jgi:hypothetical protein
VAVTNVTRVRERVGWQRWISDVIVFVVAFVTRVVVIPNTPSEWDSVQLVFGMSDFELNENSPHPPGYWLYVAVSRFVHWSTPLDETHSMSVVCALFGALACVFAWRVGNQLRGRLLGGVLALLVAAMPFNWFYGSVPAVYIFDLAAALFFASIALRDDIRAKHVVIVAVVLGLLTGTRQSALTVFGPLVLYLYVRSRPSFRSTAIAVGAGAAAVVVWLIPAGLDQSGGVSALWERSRSMWEAAARGTSFLNDAPAEGVRFNLGRATTAPVVTLLYALPVFMVLVALAAVRPFRRLRDRETNGIPLRRVLMVGALLAVPGFLVTLIHYGKPGYIMCYVPGLLLLGCAALMVLHKPLYIGGCAALTIVAGLWAHQFLFEEGLLPKRWQNDNTVWFTQDRYGTPYRDNVRKGTQLVDADEAQYKPLGNATNSNDTLVYEGAEGTWRFRQQNWMFPDRVQVLLNGNVCILAYDRRIADCPPNTVQVLPGGRAVFVANAPKDAVKAVGEPLTLPTGPTAFVVKNDQIVNGITIVENSELRERIGDRTLVVRPSA